jgi:hypothetical protein
MYQNENKRVLYDIVDGTSRRQRRKGWGRSPLSRDDALRPCHMIPPIRDFFYFYQNQADQV